MQGLQRASSTSVYISLESKYQDNCCDEENDGGCDGDAIEVLLHDGRAAYACTHASTEHVGESSTASRMEKDEEDEQDGGDDVYDNYCDVEYGYEFLLG